MRHSLLLPSELLRQNRQNAEELTVISLSRLLVTAAVFLPCLAFAQASSVIAGVETVQSALGGKKVDCPNPPPSSAPNRVALKNEICSQRKAWIEGKLANSFSLDEMISQIKAKNPDVIVLAESHFTAITDSYPEIIRKLKTAMPEIDCILFEYPSTEQKMVDKLVVNPNDATDVADGIYFMGQVIHQSAQQGIKPIAADVKWLWKDIGDDRLWRGATAEGKSERNRSLVKKMRDFIKTKQCKKIISINGKAHIYQENYLGRTLTHQMEHEKVRYSSINLQNTGSNHPAFGDGRKDESWYWNSCSENPSKLNQGTFAFKNDGYPRGMTFVEGYGQWDDFDYSLVIGSEK